MIGSSLRTILNRDCSSGGIIIIIIIIVVIISRLIDVNKEALLINLFSFADVFQLYLMLFVFTKCLQPFEIVREVFNKKEQKLGTEPRPPQKLGHLNL